MSNIQNMAEFLEMVENSGGLVIRGFRGRRELLAQIQNAIENSKTCVFAPSLKTLREFLNTDGFIAVMKEIESELIGCQTVVEAGRYDSRHLFAVAPLDRNRRVLDEAEAIDSTTRRNIE